MIHNTTTETASQFHLTVEDGTFDTAPRRNPYLYQTFFASGVGIMTLSWPCNGDTASQLRGMADQAERYMKDWNEHQRRIYCACGQPLDIEMEHDAGTCLNCQEEKS